MPFISARSHLPCPAARGGRLAAGLAASLLGAALLAGPSGCTRERLADRSDRGGDATPAAAPQAAGPEVILEPAGGGPPARVRVELARTPDELARGLMFRRELPEGSGMLFLFDREDVHRFWMRNTLIPLDMLFFDAQRRLVGIEEQTTPHDDTARGPDAPAQYVLEVPGGYARRHGIGPGSRATFNGLP